ERCCEHRLGFFPCPRAAPHQTRCLHRRRAQRHRAPAPYPQRTHRDEVWAGGRRRLEPCPSASACHARAQLSRATVGSGKRRRRPSTTDSAVTATEGAVRVAPCVYFSLAAPVSSAPLAPVWPSNVASSCGF